MSDESIANEESINLPLDDYLKARVERDRYRAALEAAVAAMRRRLGEDTVPAYYGPDSEWNQMVDAVCDALDALDGEEQG